MITIIPRVFQFGTVYITEYPQKCSCKSVLSTVFNYTVPLRPWTFPAELPATVQSPLSKLVRLATEFEAPLCIAVNKIERKKFKNLYGMYKGGLI